MERMWVGSGVGRKLSPTLSEQPVDLQAALIAGRFMNAVPEPGDDRLSSADPFPDLFVGHSEPRKLGKYGLDVFGFHDPYSNTRSYRCQYANAFDCRDAQTYVQEMELRDVLSAEMEKRGHNAYTLAELSGVPQPTINRILTGKHGDPRSSTVRKLARRFCSAERMKLPKKDAFAY